MHIVEIKDLNEAKIEIAKTKPDRAGTTIMSPKAVFRVLKIQNLPPVASNIIKQEMLSIGGEAAVSRGAINFSVEESGILVMGTLAQFKKLVQKLKQHKFGLASVAESIKQTLLNYDRNPKFKIGGKTIICGKRTYLMGILNVTPDSFYDGGRFSDPDKAIKQAYRMVEDGADIIDIGGESSRPGSNPVSANEEIKRVAPVIKKIAKDIPVSIDTYKSRVANAALDLGAAIVNDISGFHFDKKMASLVKKYNASAVLMHIQGTPKNMQKKPSYRDLIQEIINHLKEGLAIAKNTGILKDRICIDPGFGFGKTVAHNLEILKRLREFKSLGCPIMIGTSRKSTIGHILNQNPEQRIFGTAATVAVAIQNGADIIRVHDAKEMKFIAKVTDQIVRRTYYNG